MNYAGFFKRFAAFIVDLIIVVAIYVAVALLLGKLASFGVGPGIVNFAFVVVFVLYYAVFDSSKYQATPGKLLFGIKIVDANGGRLSFGTACLRSFIKNVSFIFPPIYALCIFTDKKQNIHDFAVASYVIDKSLPGKKKISKGVKIAIAVIISFILLSLAVGAIIVKSIKDTGINYESLVAESAVKGGEDISSLQFTERRFEDIGIAVAAPFNLNRNEEKEKFLKSDESSGINDMKCYGFYLSTPFDMEIMHITYGSEVNLQDVMMKYGFRNLSTFDAENAEEFTTEKNEIFGRETLSAVRYERKELEGVAGQVLQQSAETLNDTFYGKFDIVLVVRDDADKVWLIHANSGQETKIPLLEKVMDSVKILK